jgi:hypothetical protein
MKKKQLSICLITGINVLKLMVPTVKNMNVKSASKMDIYPNCNSSS